MASIDIRHVSKSHGIGVMRHNDKELREKNEHSNEHVDRERTHLNLNLDGLSFTQRKERLDSLTNKYQAKGNNEMILLEYPIIPKFESDDQRLTYVNEVNTIIDNALFENIFNLIKHQTMMKLKDKYAEENGIEKFAYQNKIYKQNEDGTFARNVKGNKINTGKKITKEFEEYSKYFDEHKLPALKRVIERQANEQLEQSKISSDYHVDEVHEIVDEHTFKKRESYEHVQSVFVPVAGFDTGVNTKGYNFNAFFDKGAIERINKNITKLNNDKYGTFFSFKHDSDKDIQKLTRSNRGKTVEDMKKNQSQVLEIYERMQKANQGIENKQFEISQIESEIESKTVVKQKLDSAIEQIDERFANNKLAIDEQVIKYNKNRNVIENQIKQFENNKVVIGEQNTVVEKNKVAIEQQQARLLNLDERERLIDERERESDERERKLFKREQRIEEIEQDMFADADVVLDTLKNKVAQSNALYELNASTNLTAAIRDIDLSL